MFPKKQGARVPNTLKGEINMKKLLSVVLALAMVLCFAGCSGERDALANPGSTTETPSVSTAEPVETPEPTQSSQTQEEPSIPDPTTIPSQQKEEMQPEVFPESWRDENTVVTLAEFNQELAEANSAYSPQNEVFTWGNGSIAITTHFINQTYYGDAYGLMVYPKDWTVNDRVIWDSAGSAFSIDLNDMSMSPPMARWLWAVMAESGQMTTIPEVKTLSDKTLAMMLSYYWPTDDSGLEPKEPDKPSRNDTMIAGVYPFLGDWVTEDEFNAAIRVAGSSFTPTGGLAFTWTNELFEARVYEAGKTIDGEISYGLRVSPLHDTVNMRGLGSGEYVLDEENSRMSLALAKALWDFMAECKDMATFDEVREYFDAK